MPNTLPRFECTQDAEAYGRTIQDPYILIALQQERNRLIDVADEHRLAGRTQAALDAAFQCQFIRECLDAYRAELQKELILQ